MFSTVWLLLETLCQINISYYWAFESKELFINVITWISKQLFPNQRREFEGGRSLRSFKDIIKNSFDFMDTMHRSSIESINTLEIAQTDIAQQIWYSIS